MKQRIIWTRDWLEKFGIKDVSADGHEYKYDHDLIQKIEHIISTSGYDELIINGQFFAVHRLVYCWFNGEIKEGMTIDHIDGNRHNNAITNLQALTYRENLIKAGYDPIHELVVKVEQHKLPRFIYLRRHMLNIPQTDFRPYRLNWNSKICGPEGYPVNEADGFYYLVFNQDRPNFVKNNDIGSLLINSDDFHLEPVPEEELPAWLKK